MKKILILLFVNVLFIINANGQCAATAWNIPAGANSSSDINVPNYFATNNVSIGGARMSVSIALFGDASLDVQRIYNGHLSQLGINLGHDDDGDTDSFNDRIETQISFSTPVTDLNFRLNDIDADDVMIVTAYDQNNNLINIGVSNYFLFTPTDITRSGNTFFGGPNDISDTRGSVRINYNGLMISRIVLQYYDTEDGGTFTATEFSGIAAQIVASTDNFSIISNTGGATASVLGNDTICGAAATTSTVTVSAVGVVPTGLTLNTNGTITVANSVTAGGYAVNYSICEIASPTNCTTSTAYVLVQDDNDGDGLIDSQDLDDDNDGVLDIIEDCTSYLAQNVTGAWKGKTTSTATVSGTAGTAVNTAVTYNDYQNNFVVNTSGSLTDGRRTVTGNINRTVTFSPAVPASEIAFLIEDVDLPAGNSFVNYTLTVNGTAPVGLFLPVIYNTANPYLIYTQDGIIVKSGNVNNQQLLLKGIGSTLVSTLTIVSSGLPADAILYSVYAKNICDTDNDGIANSVDLDSDGDSCFDAVEGDEAVLLSHLNANGSINTTANGGVGATATTNNGVPNLVNSGGASDSGSDNGQGIGTSANAALKNPSCYTLVLTADSYSGPSGTAFVISNILANDTLDTVTPVIGVSAGQVTISQSGVWTTGITLNTATGAVSIANTVAGGVYTLTYQVCVNGTSPALCQTQTITVTLCGIPVVGTITQPTCAVPTGSVALSNLPASGTWTVTDSFDGATKVGTGATTTFTNLASGSHTFTVSNASCTSAASNSVNINAFVAASATPTPTATTLSNTCPSGAADLTSLQPAPVSGYTYEWHTVASGPSAANLIADPQHIAVNGTYYLYTLSTNGCYSSGAPVVVTITNCASCANICNIVTNGNFSTALTGWTAGTGWTTTSISGNPAATNNADNLNNSLLTQTLTGLNSSPYNGIVKLTFRLFAGNFFAAGANASTGNIQVLLNNTLYATFDNNGTTVNVLTITPSNGANLYYTPNPYVYSATVPAGTGALVTLEIPWVSKPDVAALSFSFTAVGDDFGIDDVAINKCITTPVPATTTLSNICPAITANLTAIQPAAVAGETYEWHTVATNPTAGNLVATPNAVGAGSYYLYSKTTSGCYSAASAAVAVTINACADLSIHKIGPASVTPGATVTYTLLISNNGPSNVSNAIVKDPAVSNLTVNSVGSCIAGPGSGGSASCPATLTVAALQGAGLIIPSLPSGSSISLTVTGTAGSSGSIANTASITAPAGVSDISTDNNSSLYTTAIECNTGAQSIYTLNLASYATEVAAAADGGSFNLVYSLTSGTAIPGLGNTFNVPVTYSDFNQAFSGSNHTWSSIGLGSTGVSLRPNILDPTATSPFYLSLPANNSTTEPLNSNLDTFFVNAIRTNSLTQLGTFSITIGQIPLPTGTRIVSETLNTLTKSNFGSNGVINFGGWWFRAMDQPTTSLSSSETTILPINHNNTFTYRYTAFTNTTNTPPSTAGNRGVLFSDGQIIFTFATPIINTATPTNPSTCGGTNGKIVLDNLTTGTSYTINYSKNATAQTPITQTAVAGTVTIDNLTAGNYTNITVSIGTGCASNSLSASLTDPVLSTPIVGTITQPTCPLTTGSVVLSGLPASWTITDTNGGTTYTGTTSSTTINDLVAGIHNFTVNNGSCTSAPTEAVTINAISCVDISGTVFDDLNGGNAGIDTPNDGVSQGVNGPDIDPQVAGNQPLYVSLIESGVVVQTEAVQSNGTYLFALIANGTYDLVLHTQSGGSTSPSLPLNWENTTEGIVSGDGIANGTIMALNVNNANIVNADFAINKTSTADNITLDCQSNPGGSLEVNMPTLTGSDFEDGTNSSDLTGYGILVVSISGGTLYSSGIQLAAGDVFSYNASELTLDPDNASNTVFTFEFKYVDSSNMAGATATVSMSFIPCPCTQIATGGTPNGYTLTGISSLEGFAGGWPGNVPNGFVAIESKNQGFVITRTTTSAIPTAGLVEGMLIYDTIDNCVKLYNGSTWNCIEKACNTP